MDSLTHIILGAATGEVVLGKKVGNKALFWGAIAGSLPDFDVAITWMFEPVHSLFVHRGFSHSILFALIMAPLLGFIITKIHSDSKFREWTWLSLWAILIHSTIDCFNTYGTALLGPFSGARLAFDSMGIIDFFLLIPLLVLTVFMLFKPQFSGGRKKFSIAILAYTFVFLAFTSANKIFVETIFKQQLQAKQIDYNRIKTAPLPLTNFLWLVIAEDSAGYHYGYYSNFDRGYIDLSYIKRNHNNLGDFKNSSRVKNLIRFTEGYYTVKRDINNKISLHDLRFGSMAFDQENWFVFTFEITGSVNSTHVSRASPNRSFGLETFKVYVKRLTGNAP